MSQQYQYIVARQRTAELHREAERARLSDAVKHSAKADRSGNGRRVLRHVSARSNRSRAIGAILTFLLISLAAAGAASIAVAANTPGRPAPFSFTIDPSLKPIAKESHLGSVLGPDGSQLDFRTGVLVAEARRSSDVRGLLKRWRGRVLERIAVAHPGAGQSVAVYVVSVDVAEADVASLPASLARLKAGPPGKFTVSSQAALRLLAVAADEAADGLSVGLDFVARPDNLRTRSTTEAPIDLSGTFGSDAFTWPGFSNTGLPASHVGEAWNLLARAGRLPDVTHRVPIGILDVGFARLGPDAPPGSIGATQRMNVAQPCGTPNQCPWHGTDVVSAAAGLADNDFGAAGTGGPVARVVEIDRGDDLIGIIRAVATTLSVNNSVHIFNMSFGAEIPGGLGWITAPADLAFSLWHGGGAILVASAGNAPPHGPAVDVDAEDCFGICWERTNFWPCESPGVLCVGGTALSSDASDPGSNFGTATSGGTVDIWAPFDMPVGPNPSAPGNIIRRVQGTSFSAPFVAGVAALVFAANPSLSAAQVENRLLTTSRPGSGHATHIVDALAAVTSALGPDLPPDIRIVSPTPGEVVQRIPRAFLFLHADATDREDRVPPTVRWTIDGHSSVGGHSIRPGLTVAIPVTDLPLGTRIVRATATDSAGHVVDDGVGGIQIRVVPPPPVCLPPHC